MKEIQSYPEEIGASAHSVDEQRAQADFMTLLNDILRAALEAEDMSALLKVLVNRTGELFSAHECFITSWDAANEMTLPVVAYGSMSQTYHTIPVQPGQRTLTSSVLQAGHALVVEDTTNSPYFDPDVIAPFPDIRSALGLPLISGERKLGAVILGFDKFHHFTEDEISHAELAAKQISLAMTKVLLLEEARQRVNELAGLHAISKSFSLHGDTCQTYGLLSKNLAELIGARMCVIGLYDPINDEICAQLPGFGLSDEMAAFHYPADLGTRVWDLGKKGVLRANTPSEIPPEFVPLARSFGVESILVAPLWGGKHDLIGMIYAANKPAGFSDAYVHLMNVFADQVAVVIQNTHLLADERRRAEELAVLYTIAEAATEANDENELIARATRLIGEKLYPDNFGVLLLDEAAGELFLHSSYFIGERDDPIRVPLGVGITGTVARSGRARRVADVSRAPEYLNVDLRTRSELCLPLKTGERVIGVINAESRELNAFTQADEDLLTIMAGQLASAIDRLRHAAAEYQWATQMSRTNALINVLAQVATRVSAVPDPQSVMTTLGHELKRLGLTCLIALHVPDAPDEVNIRYTSADPKVVKLLERAANLKMPDFRVPTERFLLHITQPDQPSLVRDPPRSMADFLFGFPKPLLERMMKSLEMDENIIICHLPLIAADQMIGFIWLWGKSLREGDLPTMSVFASQVAIAIQNAELFTESQRLATTDGLTGVYNRRHFFALAQAEFNRAHRYKRPLSALFLDFDDFKQINDQYGHPVGDKVLRAAIDLCREQLRDIDIIGRYGGDEFIVLLTETEQKAVCVVAERLCQAVSEMRVPIHKGSIQITMSVGLAGMDENTPDLDTLIARADQAAYAAKEAGGNRVAVK